MSNSGLVEILQEGDNFTLFRDHGNNLAVTMGEALFPDLETAVMELVANSYDADATDVHIRYFPEQDKLVVSDNGEGMDEQGLQHFFRMGDSPKVLKPVSDKGRAMIGNFGIASLAVRALASEHTLESIKSGIHYKIEEEFNANDKDDKPIQVMTTELPEGQDGTEVTLRGLKFAPGEGKFDLNNLISRIKQELPIDLLDFDVYVNGSVIPPNQVRRGIEYAIDFRDSNVGDIVGSLWLGKRILPVSGVYTKVNGRAVGGTNQELFSGFKEGFKRRVYGTLDVSQLENLVRFDRSGFQDKPVVQRLHNSLKGILKQMNLDYTGEEKDAKAIAAQEIVRETLPFLGRQIASSLTGNPDSTPYSFEFNKVKAGDLVYVDQKRKRVFINPEAPPFRTGLTSGNIRYALSRIGEYAVLSALLPDADAQEKFQDFVLETGKRLGRKRKDKSLAGILPQKGTIENPEFDLTLRVSPARVYTFREVSKRTGLRNSVIKRAIASGLVETYNNKNKIVGQNVLSLRDRVKGTIPLFEVCKKVPVPEGIVDFAFWQYIEEKGIRTFDGMVKNKMPNYIRDLSLGDNPSFYVVDSRDEKKLVHLLESIHLSYNFREDPVYVSQNEEIVSLNTTDNLLSRLKERDNDAYRTLYDHSYDSIYTTIKNIVEDHERAEEISHHVYFRTYLRDIDRFRGREESLLSWLITKGKHIGKSYEPTKNRVSPGDIAALGCIQKKDQRSALIFRFDDHMSYKQMAPSLKTDIIDAVLMTAEGHRTLQKKNPIAARGFKIY
jgi:hypothetical protein